MDTATKSKIGQNLRKKRESAGYTREKLGELCNLSPRFIANIELGDSTFSLDSLLTMCRVLSCSSDDLLFGEDDGEVWSDTAAKLARLDPKYHAPVDKVVQGLIELLLKAKQ